MRNIKKILLLKILLLSFPIIGLGQERSGKVTSHVNPFIGTGAVQSSLSGNTFPGATVPFGMVQLSPDTRYAPDWAQASGYDYNDKNIYGFSHTHLSGTGVAELFDILVMPVSADLDSLANNFPDESHTYQSTFSHDRETARPGYYQVWLSRYNINAELTATAHAGFHR
ncbi:MAG: glycoside hydrolase family 92 protein, partial [Dysgonomonas sp.]